jgi:hypothetical protein
MAELGLLTLEVTQEHLQNLLSQGYMIVVEMATCRVPEDPASPVPMEGYIVACTAFYEQGFGVPSHRFPRSLLQFYGLELQHLTPSGILHMVAFMTLSKAYMGIEPHFKLWNYFFYVRLQHGLGMEVAALSNVDIFVWSRCGVDPYFHLPASGPLDGWQKAWFFLRNNIDALLPVFTGNHSIPKPNWGYGVPQKDLYRLQPLREVVWKLLQRGPTGVELMQTVFSHRVQPLHQ